MPRPSMRLSQPAISRLLAQLEEDLALRLFVREKGRLSPTAEAHALLHDAQVLMDSAQCFRRHAEQLRLGGFKRRLLKVAVPSTLASFGSAARAASRARCVLAAWL